MAVNNAFENSECFFASEQKLINYLRIKKSGKFTHSRIKGGLVENKKLQNNES